MFESLSRPLYGLKVIEDKNLTIHDGTTTITRSWKERLFTLPWRPWVATKEISNIIPNPEFFYIRHKGIVLAHPVTARKLYDELDQK